MSSFNARERALEAIRHSRDPQRRAKATSAREKAKAELGQRPPDSPAKATRALSYLLDEAIKVPGTDLRFGLDPILSFLPTVGSTVSTLFGTAILLDAIRLRTPLSVMSRMVFNYLLNWLIGLIPAVGPFIGAWWKSNSRNVKLLDRTIANRDQVRKASTTYWTIIGVVLLIIVGLLIALTVGLLMTADAWINAHL